MKIMKSKAGKTSRRKISGERTKTSGHPPDNYVIRSLKHEIYNVNEFWNTAQFASQQNSQVTEDPLAKYVIHNVKMGEVLRKRLL